MKLFKPIYLDTPDFTCERTFWGTIRFTFKTDVYQMDFDKVRAYFNMADICKKQDWKWLDKKNKEQSAKKE